MAVASKYTQVMSVIERRVRAGDYLLRDIPGERRIAEETGVSYMTARKAVTELLKKKVLIRRPDGSLSPNPTYGDESNLAPVVLLYPAFPSPYLAQLHHLVRAALREHKLTLRPVFYVHWDDPAVLEAVVNQGGALVIPSTDPPPAPVVEAFRANRVVILDGDLTHAGVPSIRLFPDQHLEQVFTHLTELGHRRIDCINTQQHNPEIDRRIALWRDWIAAHDCAGRLWDSPAASFADPTPFACELMGQALNAGRVDATALLCTTFPAALGTTRALWERGCQIGRDKAVCSMNIEYPARFGCPSMTGLDMPDLSATLDQCFNWFLGSKPWRGRLLLEPSEPLFFRGESTGVTPSI